MPRLLRFCFVTITFALVSGCTSAPRMASYISILSTPDHQQDWERVRAALEVQKIRFEGPVVNLGTFEISIHSTDTARARKLVENIVRNEKLTVRITKDADPLIYQVYEYGQKTGEESYVIR